MTEWGYRVHYHAKGYSLVSEDNIDICVNVIVIYSGRLF